MLQACYFPSSSADIAGDLLAVAAAVTLNPGTKQTATQVVSLLSAYSVPLQQGSKNRGLWVNCSPLDDNFWPAS